MVVNLKKIKGIYPPELDLNKKNDINREGSILDLGIKIRDDRFSISLYDKQDDFPFSIVRIPSLCSNVPSMIFYSVFRAEILTIAGTFLSIHLHILNQKNTITRYVNINVPGIQVKKNP